MRKCFIITLIAAITFVFVSFTRQEQKLSAARLRALYSQSPDKWPAPTIDDGVEWAELAVLPESPLEKDKDSLKHLIELGKILFFDARLSGSGKISCATCHQPELSWGDGKEKSIGHEGAVNKMNSPTIQNSWFYKKLFWDGRSNSLEDQAFAPINSESEMHSEMPELPRKLRKIKGYAPLFDSAFGDPAIAPHRITEAIAVFERTIVSRKSRFDEFLAGNKKALNNNELRGLHIFRTKARCMNCHNGSLFSDNQFHNVGFSGDGMGYYKVSHKDEDMGKFKTPSLRDVMKTGPWMHDGVQGDMLVILDKFDNPGIISNLDKLLKPLGLTAKEKKDLLAFLNAISAMPLKFNKPVLPQ
jgi:cytochrome c peroxidase